MSRFIDKRVLVTGASGGVGRALAEAFFLEGARVWGFYRSEPPKAIEGVELVCCDLKSESDVVKAMSVVDHPDIVVNCAGITANAFVENMTVEQWDETVDVNLRGGFLVTKYVLNSMKLRRSGHIINVSSIIGEVGSVGCANYAASKAGLVGFTKAVAKETCKYGVFVNALVLGYCDVGMGMAFEPRIRDRILQTIPMGRFGEVPDILRAVFFLAETTYMTGATLNLSGGM